MKKILNRSFIVIIVIFIFMLITSYAYYLFSGGSTVFDTTTYNSYINVVYSSSEYISTNNAIPISDDDIESEAEYNDFTVTIKDDNNTYLIAEVLLSISLTNITIDEELKTTDFKYQLLHNDEVVASGTGLDFDSTSIELSSKEVIYSDVISYFTFRVWLSDTGEDQSELENKTFSASIEVNAIKIRNATEYDGDTLYDTILLAENNSDTVSDAITYIESKGTPTFSTTATTDEGIYQTEEAGTDVYYYRGAVEDNNVLFAGYCWKIIRTTKTGGIKMIYNGTPTDGVCSNTGTSSQLTTKAFNSSYTSPAYVGYMYGTVYTYSSETMATTSSNSTSNTPIYRLSMTSSSTYYFASDYTVSDGTYTLTDPMTLGAWTDVYSQIPAGYGYYTCKLTTTDTCTTLYYVFRGSSSYAYTLALTNGQTFDEVNTEMTFGSSYIDNGDGTYTLSGTTTTINKLDWYSNYSSYKGLYMCSDYTSTTCSTMYYLSVTSNYNYTYINASNNYVYANDVEYDSSTGKYTLIDTSDASLKQFLNWSSNYNTLNYNHYTCFSTSNTCTSVYYIHYTTLTYAYYITLTGGKTVSDAISEMLDNNTTDSTIKAYIEDDWYYSNMTDYTDYLEDAVYCNDRSIYNYNGWNPDGGSTTSYLYFSAYGRRSSGSPSLSCDAEDSFTVSTSNGNGKLDYPVGLISVDEVMLAGGTSSSNSSYYLYTGSYYWAGSPCYFTGSYSYGFRVYSSGYLYSFSVSSTGGVRPVVSLKPGTTITGGDGTSSNPYVVLTN